MIFRIKVVYDAPSAQDAAFSPMHQEGQKYQRAFLSYAHEDRIEVLKAAQLMHALKISYFQDLLSESSGRPVARSLALGNRQERCFFAILVKACAEIQMGHRKVEYALQRSQAATPSHPFEIVPVLLEGPPPPLPPKSLNDIHFNDAIRYVIFAENSGIKALIR